MIAGILAKTSSLVCGTSVEWRCDPHSSAQRVYFGNHSSHLDFVIIWSALPAEARRLVRPVAGSDYWQRGVVRRHLADRVFHAVLISRTPGIGCRCDAAKASVRRMADEIGARCSLIVFPEGTRGVDGEVGAFKSGLFHLSRLRPDVELVPVFLENLNRILPKGEVLPVPMLSRVVFGSPLPRVPGEGKQEFLARSREALVHLQVAS
jgi:1-acyl-sn-glycerol-3-phosphate acyltransferase